MPAKIDLHFHIRLLAPHAKNLFSQADLLKDAKISLFSQTGLFYPSTCGGQPSTTQQRRPGATVGGDIPHAEIGFPRTGRLHGKIEIFADTFRQTSGSTTRKNRFWTFGKNVFFCNGCRQIGPQGDQHHFPLFFPKLNEIG